MNAAQCGSSFNPYTAGPAAAETCGLNVHPLKEKVALPDGGTQYTYDVDGGTLIQRTPPSGFDPLKASAAQLAYYYYPPRPSSDAALAAWEMSVTAHHGTPPPFLVQGPTPLSQPQAYPAEAYNDNCPTGGIICSSNWSGYSSQATTGSYSSVETSYSEPNPAGTQPCTNNALAMWAGLGGMNGSSILAQAGTAYNTGSFTGIPNHGAWAEVTPAGPIYLNYWAAANDSMEASVSHQSGGFQFYVTDATQDWTAQYFWSTSSYDGSTAEAVVERPWTGSYLTTLTQFSSPDEFSNTLVNGTAMNGLSNHSPIYMYSNATQHELSHVGTMWSSYGDFYDYYDNCG